MKTSHLLTALTVAWTPFASGQKDVPWGKGLEIVPGLSAFADSARQFVIDSSGISATDRFDDLHLGGHENPVMHVPITIGQITYYGMVAYTNVVTGKEDDNLTDVEATNAKFKLIVGDIQTGLNTLLQKADTIPKSGNSIPACLKLLGESLDNLFGAYISIFPSDITLQQDRHGLQDSISSVIDALGKSTATRTTFQYDWITGSTLGAGSSTAFSVSSSTRSDSSAQSTSSSDSESADGETASSTSGHTLTSTNTASSGSATSSGQLIKSTRNAVPASSRALPTSQLSTFTVLTSLVKATGSVSASTISGTMVLPRMTTSMSSTVTAAARRRDLSGRVRRAF